MKRTIRNVMDAFVQHLAFSSDQFWTLNKTQKDLEGWLGLELRDCLECLRHVQKFRGLFGERRKRRQPGSRAALDHDGGTGVRIAGPKGQLWLRLGCLSTGWRLEPHLERIKSQVGEFKGAHPDEMKIFVEVVVSRGKWAHKTIEDCLSRIQDGCGLHFEPYAPELWLTPYNECQDPSAEELIVRVLFSYIR